MRIVIMEITEYGMNTDQERMSPGDFPFGIVDMRG